MVLTARRFDGNVVSGVLTYDYFETATTPNPVIQVCNDVCADIGDAIAYPSGVIADTRINWFAEIYVVSNTNSSKFKSALPKFDYGVMCTSWHGVQTSEVYINYNRQIVGDYSCMQTGASTLYPAAIPVPSFLDDATMGSMSALAGVQTRSRADVLYYNGLASFTGILIIRIWYVGAKNGSTPPYSSQFFQEDQY